jgi:hypothetical protein
MATDYIVRLVSPETLKPFKHNARTHPPKQIEQIAGSIRRYGFTNPILIDEESEIIAGHGRLLAAKKLRMTEVPALTVTGLSDLEKRGLRLSDNRIPLGASWDKELLQIELREITLEAPDLIEFSGFEIGEIDVLLADGEADPDDEVVPAVPVQPVSEIGDIWLVGPHRVGCGDAKDVQFVREVTAGPVHAAFMDPPFNQPIAGHVGGNGRIKHREFHEASGEMTEAQFVAFLKATLGSAVDVSVPGAVHFLCMDHHHLNELFEAASTLYDRRLNMCVWKKSNAGMGSLYRSHHELVAVYRVPGAPHRNNVELGRHGRNRTNIWSYASVNTFGGSRQQDLVLHPTVKPLGLVADAIMDVTRRGEKVLDLFLGSGTTLMAAERVGRVFAGLDIDPGYVDVALDRWMQMTGGQVRLKATGQTFEEVRAERLGAGEAAA